MFKVNNTYINIYINKHLLNRNVNLKSVKHMFQKGARHIFGTEHKQFGGFSCITKNHYGFGFSSAFHI